MAEELSIGPGTTLTVVAHDERELEFRALYSAGGSPPPAHLHPAQDERFEILQGAMRARIPGREQALQTGDSVLVPHGTAHQMWNDDPDTEAVMSWRTTPAGRTLEWFRLLAALAKGEEHRDPATLLQEYADVYRLVES